jgi:hypothetical protein
MQRPAIGGGVTIGIVTYSHQSVELRAEMSCSGSRAAGRGTRLVDEAFDTRELPRIAYRRGLMTLNRRELPGYFLTFSLAVPTLVTMAAAPSAAAPASGIAANAPGRTVKFHDGTVVPALGQGSARLGKGRHSETVEEEALREGISLGMTLIDTAEIYGNGDAEKLIGRVVAGRREHVFLVSKVWPTHVAGDGIERACEGSLARLGTDYLDLYLLHWPNGITDLSGVVAGFENLRFEGKDSRLGRLQFQSQRHGTASKCSARR